MTLTPAEVREQTAINVDYVDCVEDVRSLTAETQLEREGREAAERAAASYKRAAELEREGRLLEASRADSAEKALKTERRRGRWRTVKSVVVAVAVGVALGAAFGGGN